MAGNTKKLTRCATHCLYYQPQKQANAPQKVQDPGLTHSLTHRPWQLVVVTKGTKKKIRQAPAHMELMICGRVRVKERPRRYVRYPQAPRGKQSRGRSESQDRQS